MSTVATSIEVNVPVRTAYNQWTQFEEFPQFMEGVKAVQQLDDPVFIGRQRSGEGKKNGMRKSPNRFLTSALPGRVSAEP